MSFNPLMTLVTAAVLPDLEASPTVVELGNQSFRASNRALQAVTEQLRDRPEVDIEGLRMLMATAKRDRLPMTETYYRALGFSDYKAIDINDRFGSLIMDLNQDLADHYGFHKQFSLVTNNGTGEHIFDQCAVFKNIHGLCKPGGMMIHIMPFELYVNHGFYSYHPGLYFDLSAANGYRMHLIGFANRSGQGVIGRAHDPAAEPSLARRRVLLKQEEIPLAEMRGQPDFRETTTRGWIQATFKRISSGHKDSHHASPALTRALWRTMNAHSARKILIFAVLQKGGDAPFEIPIQDVYSGDIAEGEIKERYAVR